MVQATSWTKRSQSYGSATLGVVVSALLVMASISPVYGQSAAPRANWEPAFGRGAGQVPAEAYPGQFGLDPAARARAGRQLDADGATLAPGRIAQNQAWQPSAFSPTPAVQRGNGNMMLMPVQQTVPGTAAATPPAPGTPTGPRIVTDRQVIQQQRQGVMLNAGSGRVFNLTEPAASLFSADPAVVEVRAASPTSIFMLGVAPGRTTVAALSATGNEMVLFDVTVRASAFPKTEVEGRINRQVPGARVSIDPMPNGAVISGQVNTAQDAERVMTLVRAHLEDDAEVVNRLTVAHSLQVNLRVRVAEMSRQVTRNLGLNWQSLLNGGAFTLGLRTAAGAAGAISALLPLQGLSGTGVGSTSRPDTLGFGYRGTNWDINGVIDALAGDNLVTILAEPNLTAVSGQAASFLAGGEIPIPVRGSRDEITVEWKPFGVSLAFVPTVMGPNRISLRVRPEVSEISQQDAIIIDNIRLPSLTVRRAETTVELGSGQSFALAGLLSDSTRQASQGLPVLSELPILGALFKSDGFRRTETELVIIVTPYLVRPVSEPRLLSVPNDQWSPPNDIERLFFSRLRARGQPAQPSPRLAGDPGFMFD
ncbi:MAG: type II and III secretion system protein family protein [Alphaproteobacteria bacterium]|nr:type II and III secretion system protein family protein [Alphaproteobacteria bacterium]